MDRNHPVQFMACLQWDGMGKILSRHFPFSPFKSGHFAGFKAEGPLS
jgi:hypothetical protein